MQIRENLPGQVSQNHYKYKYFIETRVNSVTHIYGMSTFDGLLKQSPDNRPIRKFIKHV